MATRERSDSEDCPDARPSCLDVVQLWEESHYSGKAIVKTVWTLHSQSSNLSRIRFSEAYKLMALGLLFVSEKRN
jgi:hypothetical protein